MSEAIERVRDLLRAGFAFLHHRDSTGEITAVNTRAEHLDTVLAHGEHESIGRCRDEAFLAVLWHPTGAITEVLTALPAPGARSAPRLARTEPSKLRTPGCVDST